MAPRIKYLTPTIAATLLEMYAIPAIPIAETYKTKVIGKRSKDRVMQHFKQLVYNLNVLCTSSTITLHQGRTRKTMSFKLQSSKRADGIWYAYGHLNGQQVTLRVDHTQPYCEVIYNA